MLSRTILSLLSVVLLGMAAGAVEPAKRPNVLFIAVDDLNHWVGHLGRNPQTKTPNIDKLAARGVTFSRAYCAAPACNPSRAALMSGLRPSTTGVYHNPNDWRPFIARDMTLVSTFRKAGYFTAGAGKIYHGGLDRTDEWEDYFKPSNEARKAARSGGESLSFGLLTGAKLAGGDEAVPDYAITNYCIEQLGKKHDRPFFICCGEHKPHLPWSVPKKYFDLFPLDKIELPPHIQGDLDDVPQAGKRMARPDHDHAAVVKAGKWKEAVQAYLAAIAYTDMNIGRLVDALDKSAYRDNTIIVFWGDHGWSLGEKEHWRKFALWEEPTRAPFVWVVPGVTKPRTVCDRTVDFLSIYPTLCDVCGITPPKHLEGRSIKSLLADPKSNWEGHALTTHGFQNHALRTEQYRYIRYADGSEELYDHAKDPYEWKNLAGNSGYASIKSELAKRLPQKNAPEVKR